MESLRKKPPIHAIKADKHNPPKNPSHVFLGLTREHNNFLPKNLPAKYAPTSAPATISTIKINQVGPNCGLDFKVTTLTQVATKTIIPIMRPPKSQDQQTWQNRGVIEKESRPTPTAK